jgi:hypothetical protein
VTTPEAQHLLISRLRDIGMTQPEFLLAAMPERVCVRFFERGEVLWIKRIGDDMYDVGMVKMKAGESILSITL